MDQQTPTHRLSLGQCLAAAREKLLLSQQDIAQQMNLNLQTIIDLENDDYSPNRPMIYTRGYVRRYAHIVSLEVQDLLDELDALDSTHTLSAKIQTHPITDHKFANLQPKRSCYRRWGVNFLLVCLIATGIGGSWWYLNSLTSLNRPSTLNLPQKNGAAIPSLAIKPLKSPPIIQASVQSEK